MRASTYQRKASKIVNDTASEINAYFISKKEEYKRIQFPVMKEQKQDEEKAFFQWKLPVIKIEDERVNKNDRTFAGESILPFTPYTPKAVEAVKCFEIINGIKKPRIKGEQIETTAEQIGNIFYLTIIFNHKGVKNERK